MPHSIFTASVLVLGFFCNKGNIIILLSFKAVLYIVKRHSNGGEVKIIKLMSSLIFTVIPLTVNCIITQGSSRIRRAYPPVKPSKVFFSIHIFFHHVKITKALSVATNQATIGC